MKLFWTMTTIKPAALQPLASSSSRVRGKRRKSTLPYVCLCVMICQLLFLVIAFRIKVSNENYHAPEAIHQFHKSSLSHDRQIDFSVPNKRPDQDLPKNVKFRSMEDEIVAQFDDLQSAKTCRWYRRNRDGRSKQRLRLVKDDDCDDAKNMVVYNSLDSRDRYLCGTRIPAGGYVKLDKPCHEPSRVYKHDATLNAQGMADIVVSSSEALPDGVEAEPFDCDVPCQKYDAESSRARYILGTPWQFAYSMEATDYYPELDIDPKKHKYDHYYATTSFQSEIPLPFFSWAEYDIKKPAVEFDKAHRGASFIASNCDSHNKMEEIVQELRKIIRVDCLDECLKNADVPDGLDLDNNAKAIQQKYLFNIAFETSNEIDHVTSVLWGALERGTIPIYYGAPNVKEHAPPNSIISWHDFNNTKALGAHILRVMNDKTLYDSYHEWRSGPLPESFRNKYDFTHTHSICRMCRWSYAKMYGLAWNHTEQKVVDLTIPRKLCRGINQLVTHPFRESWLRGSQLVRFSEDQGTCQDTGADFSVDVISWTRSIWFHDGIVDIFLEGSGEDITYQITTPLGETCEFETLQDTRHFRLQNATSRYSFLTSWPAKPRYFNGALNFELRGESNMQIRVITEEINTFYPTSDKETSYFADVMIKDFFNPIEKFLVHERGQ